MRVLAQVRSLLGVGSLVVWLLVGELWERFVVWPAMRLRPGRADAILAWYMKGMSRGIFAIIRAAGGRAARTGTIPTAAPALIIMNHQSLLDIPTATLMAAPYICRFIARARYGRFVPSVSLCMRLLGCPLIEPSNRKASLRALRDAARDQPHGLVVFPEGHRTRDGEIQPRPDAYSAYDLFVVVSAYVPFYRSLRRAGRLRRRPALAAALNAWLPPNQVSVPVALAGGTPVLAKCAVVSEAALARGTSVARKDHFMAGRLFQPTEVVFVADESAGLSTLEALVSAHALTYEWGRAWLPARFDVADYCRT